MEQYKKEFIEFMIDCNVLKFGDFVTKSGRKTPFFVNTGFYRTGSQLKRLGEYYAQAIHDHFGFDFDVLFGPAYKGIPLSVAATIATTAVQQLAAEALGHAGDMPVGETVPGGRVQLQQYALLGGELGIFHRNQAGMR